MTPKITGVKNENTENNGDFWARPLHYIKIQGWLSKYKSNTKGISSLPKNFSRWVNRSSTTQKTRAKGPKNTKFQQRGELTIRKVRKLKGPQKLTHREQ